MKNIVFVFGTRPEVIKLAPIILAFKKIKKLKTILVSTGQHDELLKETLDAFGLKPDADFAIMKPGQSLSYILSKVLTRLDNFFSSLKVDVSIIQGDTSSALAGALTSFHHKIPVIHVEAGCRSGNIYEPFPEEVNRKLIAAVASWHFPPTEGAKNNLLSEGVKKERIFLVGSTEVDAVEWILKNTRAHLETSARYDVFRTPTPRLSGPLGDLLKTHIFASTNSVSQFPLVVITTHRRENWGRPLTEILSALKYIAETHPNIHFIYSVHPNPLVFQPVMETLSDFKNLVIITHLSTVAFVHLVSKASLIMTDSGGVQLQAGALRKPVLVFRNVTEWPEILEVGVGKLVGTNKQAIISAFAQFIANKWPKKLPEKPIYPKGAADKIVKKILEIIHS